MKSVLCVVLAVLLLCSSCDFSPNDEEMVRFCYCRSFVSYGSEDSVLAWEERALSDSSQDFETLLALYLQGPLSSDLTLPLPAGTSLIRAVRSGGNLALTFSDKISLAQGIDLTVLALCISSTCFSLCDAQQVVLMSKSGGTLFTIQRDQEFILFDPLPSSISGDTGE